MFDFTGYGENVLTFKTENEEIAGVPVKVVSNGCVDAAEAADDFCGIAVSVRGEIATVLMSGYVELPYSGTEPTHGNIKITADGQGGVTVTQSGKTVTVVKIDPETSKIGFIF